MHEEIVLRVNAIMWLIACVRSQPGYGIRKAQRDIEELCGEIKHYLYQDIQRMHREGETE